MDGYLKCVNLKEMGTKGRELLRALNRRISPFIQFAEVARFVCAAYSIGTYLYISAFGDTVGWGKKCLLINVKVHISCTQRILSGSLGEEKLLFHRGSRDLKIK